MLRFTWPLLLGLVAYAQQPIAYVEQGGEAELLRAGANFKVPLARGQFLFPGDRVSVGGGNQSVIWFCPAKQIVRASQGAEIVFDPSQVRHVIGPFAAFSATPFCELPQVDKADLFRPRYLNLPAGRLDGSSLTIDEVRSRLQPGQERMLEELQAAQMALNRDPSIAMARISKGAILERLGMDRASLTEYQAVGAESPELKELVHRSQAKFTFASRVEQSAPAPRGRTLALLVGISKYTRKDRELRYAHKDASVFYSFLTSPRGGHVPESQIALLVDEQATNERIRSEMQKTLVDRAQPGDTIVFFFSAHGATEAGRPYLVPTDGDPDNLHDSAIEMGIIGELLKLGAGRRCRVLIFLDVCRAGAAAGPNLGSSDVGVAEDTDIMLMMATRPNKPAIEAKEFGGGHSAFSYFVLRGLNGDADEDKNGNVESDELFEYVRREVLEATRKCQVPTEYTNIRDHSVIVPDLTLPGIQMEGWTYPPGCAAAPRLEAFVAEPVAAVKSFEAETLLEATFLAALSEPEIDENLLFASLDQLKTALVASPSRYLELVDQLRAALQDRGQQVILHYLEGEAQPQNRSDFVRGERYYGAALRLDPDAPALLGRWHFCRGRVLIFDKQYAAAISELQQAVLFDPEGPYVYNAFGIAYLEQGLFATAIDAFREAQRLAPRWLYPRHNLALALSEDGQFDHAREVLQAAMRQAPGMPYLAYSKGLLETRVNRLDEATKAFRRTIELDPKRAFGYDGLAFVMASRGKTGEAERLYREALAIEPDSPSIRHNFALLLLRIGRPAEAITAWDQVLKQSPDYVPGLAGLSEYQASQGNWASVIPLARRLLLLRPEYVPGRLLLASALYHTGEPNQALTELGGVNRESAEVLMLRGDILTALHRGTEAIEQYHRVRGVRGTTPALRRAADSRIRTIMQ